MPAATARIPPRARLLLRVLALAFAVATVLAAMGASQSQAYYAVAGGTPPPWSQSLLWSAAQWYAWALLVPFVVYLGLRFRFGAGARLAYRCLQHAIFALGFVLTHLLIQTDVLWFLLPGGRAFLGSFGKGMLTLLVTTLQWELLSYAIVLAAVHAVLYLRHAQAETLARKEMETEAARARLSALKRQMQPHFLFNALNALVALQREDSPEQRYTIRLAAMLRQLLNAGDRIDATLGDELTLANAYLHIERARFGDRLAVHIDVPETLRDTRLPAFILQPLVENAVTHGVAGDPDGGEVRVQASRSAGEILVEVVNVSHAPLRGANRGNGLALENCRRRLELMYGPAARFEAAAESAHAYRACIIVPATRVAA